MALGELKKFEFDFFPLATQKKIASILSAYDDLIENNKRRIAILEKMAEEIYREWFVRMRFPTSAKATAGKPFEVKRFGEVYDIQYGSNLPTERIEASGRFPVYGAGGMLGFYSTYNIDHKISLITCRGNGSGTVWRTSHHEAFVTNNSFRVRNRLFGHDEFYFSYFHLKTCAVERALSGSAQPQITIDGLSKIQIRMPHDALVREFIGLSKPILEMIDKLYEANVALAKIRDLLLPRLISGKLSVENLALPSNETLASVSSALPEQELAHA
jgi:type I restriction enzyme S subunit